MECTCQSSISEPKLNKSREIYFLLIRKFLENFKQNHVL